MRKGIIAMTLCLLLTGCWDELQLKKLLFVDTIGIDYEGDSKNLKVGYIISFLREANMGGGKPSGLYIQSTGKSLYDAVANTNKETPGILTTLETRLYLITPRFAKDQPLNYLNSAGQFISNPLYAYLAMYDGDLSKLLAKSSIKNQTVSEFLIGILDDEKKRGRIPTNKLLHLILGGKNFVPDFALNRFEPVEDGVRLAGVGLFSDGKYTDVNLNSEETQLAYLMDAASANNQLIASELGGDYYSVQVQNIKREYHINHDGKDLSSIDIDLKLDLKLVEDGLNVKKHTPANLAELEKSIGQDLTMKVTRIMATLQKANCDYLQLGHELAAFHPELYKGMDWRKGYPEITIKPQVKVRILNTGILG